MCSKNYVFFFILGLPEAKDETETEEKYLKYSCTNCSLRFKTMQNRTDHFKDTHGKCTEPNCDMEFGRKVYLEKHLIKFHGKSKCTQCHEIMNSDELKVHITNVHSTKAVCDLCAKCFKSRGSLSYHYKMEHANTRKLQCDICKMW